MKNILMCRPNYYRVDYVINPWMKIGSVDQTKALKQWEKLVDIYHELGVDVAIIEQQREFPDMVFAADQGVLVDDGTILLSRFRYKERQGESEIYEKWYSQHGYKVRKLSPDMYFEGNGELQSWKNAVLIGTGFRTSKEAAFEIGKILNKEILTIELINESFYHLDTCLMVLDDKTVFYYPPALSEKSVELLRTRVTNLIPIEEVDVNNFASNGVVIGSTVIMQTGCKAMSSKLGGLGYQVKEIDLSEFMKAGGGAHCLTGYLPEKVDNI